MTLPARFPWTSDFASLILKDKVVHAYLRQTVEKGRPNVKYLDPSTESWDATKTNLGDKCVPLDAAKAVEAAHTGVRSILRPSMSCKHLLSQHEKEFLEKFAFTGTQGSPRNDGRPPNRPPLS